MEEPTHGLGLVRGTDRALSPADTTDHPSLDTECGALESAVDARRMMVDLKQRLAEFGLSLHDDKTRLIAFGRLPAMARQQRGERRPETFAFLGFTHYCGWTRDGRFIVKHKTQSQRLTRKLKALRPEARRRRGVRPR